ncbi:hypothetical protein H6776_02580 [Candidatus Nomurabacteria bacterium]|nr:hypothetical protein [Candidatus Nomurabacteria bacterium]
MKKIIICIICSISFATTFALAATDQRILTLNSDYSEMFNELGVSPTNRLTWKLMPEYRAEESSKFNVTCTVQEETVSFSQSRDTVKIVYSVSGELSGNIEVSQIKLTEFDQLWSAADIDPEKPWEHHTSFFSAQTKSSMIFISYNGKRIILDEVVDQLNTFSITDDILERDVSLDLQKGLLRIYPKSHFFGLTTPGAWNVYISPPVIEKKDLSLADVEQVEVEMFFTGLRGNRTITFYPDSIVFSSANNQVKMIGYKKSAELAMDIMFILSFERKDKRAYFVDFWDREQTQYSEQKYVLFSVSIKEQGGEIQSKRLSGSHLPTYGTYPDADLAKKGSEKTAPYANQFAEMLLGWQK